MDVKIALEKAALYERNAMICLNALEQHACSSLAAGKHLSDDKSLRLSVKYQEWLSGLHDIQCLLRSSGYPVDDKKMPVIKRIKQGSTLPYKERLVIMRKIIGAGEQDNVIFIDGCMMWEWQIQS